MYVKGRLKTRKYTDKDGVEKYCTEILATEMQLLGGRDGGGSGGDDDNSSPAPARSAVPARGAPAASKPSTSPTQSSFDDMDDDIPF